MLVCRIVYGDLETEVCVIYGWNYATCTVPCLNMFFSLKIQRELSSNQEQNWMGWDERAYHSPLTWHPK